MLEAAIVGATGVVGQQFILALQGHPWFRISGLYATKRSAGKKYRDAITEGGVMRWYQDEPAKDEIMEMKVRDVEKLDPRDYDLIFTGIESEFARELEPRLAKRRPVISTASAFRYEDDVPILIPGVNDAHARLIEVQRERRGWDGFIVPIPNCTTTGLVVSMKPIYDSFGIELVIMTSMQAVSGAGRRGGVLALDIIDNVIPYIPKEEEKVEAESRKILGKYEGGRIIPAEFGVSCTCTRVNVRDGHTEAVYLSLKKRASVDEVKEAMREFAPKLYSIGLPSAPRETIVVLEDEARPQPRLDRDTQGGMATVVGRIREDKALKNGIKYVLVSHNTKMGAAKGAVLVAELLSKLGYIKRP
ncbi:MAG: aspartate-semialdehyde dehydrogenase [Thaumarchaeota archaeon]|nr:aspartate-semialdehyde dehydrogenase [Nitrososphaerota archaeon]